MKSVIFPPCDRPEPRWNGTAAPAEGSTASTVSTPSTVSWVPFSGGPPLALLLQGFRDFLRRVDGLKRGDSGWHEEFHGWLARVHAAYLRGEVGREDLRSWRRDLGAAFNGVQTCQALAWGRSRGAGLDLEVLDRIESGWTSAEPGLAKWDDLFHGEPAIRSLRSRCSYFRAWLGVRAERALGRAPRVVDLGCGPGRAMTACSADGSQGSTTAAAAKAAAKVRWVAVDGDPRALARVAAAGRVGGEEVEPVCVDPVRYVPAAGTVDMVWSAGLLERLSDRLAVTVLRRLWESLGLGAELALGNLGSDNPSRAYLEIVAGWAPYHRDAEDLMALARQAGIPAGAAEVGAMESGRSLFLHVRKVR